MQRKNIVTLVISLIGVLLLLLSYLFKDDIALKSIFLGTGCSIIAVVIIGVVEHNITKQDENILKVVAKWKLASIFETRQAMNSETNELLKSAENLDIAALGCSGFINKNDQLLRSRIEKGMKIRFLVPDSSSEGVKQRERDENENKGNIEYNIKKLIEWVEDVNLNYNYNKVEIKEYKNLPIESILIIDNNLFTGPFMVGKKSQLTLAYHYKRGGEGYEVYKDYFDSIWEKSDVIK